MRTAGIILAGGIGVRFQSELSRKKQFIKFNDEPLFFKALRCYDSSDQFGKIVISLPKEDIYYYKKLVMNLSLKSKIDFVKSGKTRQHSVLNAFNKIKDVYDIVVIHDGVRPFIRKKWINKIIEQTYNFDGAIIAIPSSDTLKISKDKKKISKTINRDEIWCAQTPQSFKVSILKKAFQYSIKNNFIGTDESQLVEKIGGKVVLVLGDTLNIKLTKKEDLIIAEAILGGLNFND